MGAGESSCTATEEAVRFLMLAGVDVIISYHDGAELIDSKVRLHLRAQKSQVITKHEIRKHK